MCQALTVSHYDQISNFLKEDLELIGKANSILLNGKVEG